MARRRSRVRRAHDVPESATPVGEGAPPPAQQGQGSGDRSAFYFYHT